MKEKITTGAILLENPKFEANVAQVYRTAANFLIPQVIVSGFRLNEEIKRIPREFRYKEYKNTQLIWSNNLYKLIKESNIEPVIIELLPNTQDLKDFEHPPNACYIFGPEDGNISSKIRSLGKHFVKIDTAFCLNLSIAVGITLYDKELKGYKNYEHTNK